MSAIQLDKLGRKHQKWCELVRNMGCNEDFIEDVVQDSYIKVHTYLKRGVNIDYGSDDVNDYYFYLTLKSVYVNMVKKLDATCSFVNGEFMEFALNTLEDEVLDIEAEKAYAKLINSIFKEVNTWGFYSKGLFKAYYLGDHSFDTLSKDIGIGRSSVYNSVKQHREIIRELFKEDVEDYLNRDFDKI